MRGQVALTVHSLPSRDVQSKRGSLFLDIINNPLHEERPNQLECTGSAFDPTVFSLDDVNERLPGIKP